MSYALTQLVWFASGIKGNTKLVLLSLCWRAKRETLRCHPQIPTIGANCGLDDRTVQKQLESLRSDGFISVKVRPGRKARNTFRINARAIGRLPLKGTARELSDFVKRWPEFAEFALPADVLAGIRKGEPFANGEAFDPETWPDEAPAKAANGSPITKASPNAKGEAFEDGVKLLRAEVTKASPHEAFGSPPSKPGTKPGIEPGEVLLAPTAEVALPALLRFREKSADAKGTYRLAIGPARSKDEEPSGRDLELFRKALLRHRCTQDELDRGARALGVGEQWAHVDVVQADTLFQLPVGQKKDHFKALLAHVRTGPRVTATDPDPERSRPAPRTKRKAAPPVEPMPADARQVEFAHPLFAAPQLPAPDPTDGGKKDGDL